jgi:1-acyl-sn-glycerol-3-phosphate acyltransferase
MRVATDLPATPWNALGDRIPSRGNRLTRWLARTTLRLTGWTPVGALPNLPKFVIIAAPHTSNWDFPLGILFLYASGFRVSFFGKHVLFQPPFGWVMRWLGGRPIDRSAAHGVVEQTVRAIREAGQLVVTLAPEGTRKRTEQWRTGFYRVAVGAGLPIVLAFFDYGKKEVGLGPTIWPTGDLEADLADIQAFYRTKTAKHPERFATAPVRTGPAA